MFSLDNNIYELIIENLDGSVIQMTWSKVSFTFYEKKKFNGLGAQIK